MKRSYLLPVVLGLLCCSVASAQSAISWMDDPKAGVEAAKKSKKPLMIYVLAGTKDRDEEIERGQKRSLADPRVVKMSKSFVPLKLSRSVHREYLKQFGINESANLNISFVTPSGEKIDDLSAQGLTKVDSTVQKMVLVLKNYRMRIFEQECRKVLDDPASKPEDVRAALKKVKEFEIVEADTTLVRMLEREKDKKLSADIAKEVIDLLAEISTKPAVEKLIALVTTAGENELKAPALRVLANCKPPAAEQMVEKLDIAAAEFPYDVYVAVCKICKIDNVKPDKFFTGTNERIKKDEMARVKALAKKAADKWREQNADR